MVNLKFSNSNQKVEIIMDIGAKLKSMRTVQGLTQEELAGRAELTKGFISQLERNNTSPSIATLTDILMCLGSDLQQFFSEEEDKQVVFKKKDYFVKEDQELKNSVEWVVPNATKNIMEPIRMTLKAGGSSLEDQPHEGEEFGYVMKGTVTIHLGKEQHVARKGDSFYFQSSVVHYIENTGSSEAVVLWISSPPSF